MAKKLGLIDGLVQWGIQRAAFAANTWKTQQLDTQDRQLVSMFLSNVSDGDPFTKLADDQKRRIAVTVSWIYSDIRLFANTFSSANGEVKRIEGEQLNSIKNHPFELLLRKPNDKMDLSFLWIYTIKWMQLKGNAYWFLAPAAGNAKEIVEIWPIPADRVKPIPDKEKMLRGYQYTTLSGQSKIILPEYVVHFQFPNPFTLLDGEVPLNAALLAMETEIGTGKFQRDTYVSGRGMPRSIISLPEETGERDFISLSAQIRHDFEEEQKVIITRAGDVKATTLGLTQKEMELIGQREFTRDEIDVVFLGYELHGKQTESELRQRYRMFQDTIIHPTHRLVAGQISVQALHRFYGEDLVYEFDDIRTQDRALNVQERNVYWRVKKFNEARQDLMLPPYEDDEIGNLPVPLATDPAYVSALKGLSVVGTAPGGKGGNDPKSPRRLPSPNAAMSESDAPVNQLSDAAKDIPELPQAAIDEGIRTELNRWRKVATKESVAGRNPGLYSFKSEVLPPRLYHAIRGGLLECDKTETEIKTVFENTKLSDTRGGGRGRKNKQTIATNAYQGELAETYEDWTDETAKSLADAKDAESRKRITDERLAILLVLLIALGRKTLPNAIDIAVGNNGQSPELVDKLAEALRSNETYLATSLIPAIATKLQRAFDDPDILLAISSGAGEETLRAVLFTVESRVESYATEYWNLYNWGVGLDAKENNKPIKAFLDPQAQHCTDCPIYHDEAGRLYESFSEYLSATSQRVPGDFKCQSGCRCWLSQA